MSGTRVYGTRAVLEDVLDGALGPPWGRVRPSKDGLGPVWMRQVVVLDQDKAEDQGALATESMQKGLRGPGSGVNVALVRLVRRLRRRKRLYRGS